MKLSELGETGFLEELRARFPPSDDVPVGIGDDAAAISLPDGEKVLLTVDVLVEGAHFTRETLPPKFLGRKAVAASTSDVAAMGGVGLGVLLSLVVEGDLDVESLWQLVDGAAERADELGMKLVGGNISATEGPIVVDVTVAGATIDGRTLRRDGARPGDSLFVSGRLGASACGLKLLQEGAVLSSAGSLVVPERLRDGPLALVETCLRAHLDPEPRLALGKALNERNLATACIDLSDGLSIDLARLCRASEVSARVDEPSLPIHPGVLAWERAWKRDPTALAISGGEDYELLFAARNVEDIQSLSDESEVLITKIGTLGGPNEPTELVRRQGPPEPLTASGWDHFRGRER